MLLHIFQSSICIRFYCCCCSFLFLWDCLLSSWLAISPLVFFVFDFHRNIKDRFWTENNVQILESVIKAIILKMQIKISFNSREFTGPFDIFKYCTLVLFVTTEATLKMCFIILAKF